MAKPWKHAERSAKLFGGQPEDYMDLHNVMDSPKSAVGDNRFRVFTHNAWFIGAGGPLERIFGPYIINSDGTKIPTRDVGEQHIMDDYQGRFIPTAQDFMENMVMQPWMNNGNSPDAPSSTKNMLKTTKMILNIKD